MYRLAFMVMYQQKLEQVAQVVLLTIFTKMQVAASFRSSGGNAKADLQVGRCWRLNFGSGGDWSVCGSPCYNLAT